MVGRQQREAYDMAYAGECWVNGEAGRLACVVARGPVRSPAHMGEWAGLVLVFPG
jgi:hypothetical protein